MEEQSEDPFEGNAERGADAGHGGSAEPGADWHPGGDTDDAASFASLRGQFLVAGPHLRDRNFFKTVVLVLEHTAIGAMGLVVNRPSSLTVCNALAGHFELVENDETVYLGGPVEPTDLFLLHHNDSWDEASVEVAPGLFVTTDPQAFEAIVATKRREPRRVVSGYAGWSSGQLDAELASGDWLVTDVSVPDIFAADPYELWDEMKHRVSRALPLTAAVAPHPEWN